MKKFELVAAVAKQTGLTQRDVNSMIDAMSEVITSTCRDQGEIVNLPSLGIFKPKVNVARKGRNPMTGAVIDIPESHTLKFTASSALKKVVG